MRIATYNLRKGGSPRAALEENDRRARRRSAIGPRVVSTRRSSFSRSLCSFSVSLGLGVHRKLFLGQRRRFKERHDAAGRRPGVLRLGRRRRDQRCVLATGSVRLHSGVQRPCASPKRNLRQASKSRCSTRSAASPPAGRSSSAATSISPSAIGARPSDRPGRGIWRSNQDSPTSSD